ncbi:MAG: flagellar hook-basal body complex protein [Rhodobacteraceae bacterium]|nr:flagellar hook-basal body complex protein [Paracoccaceae bacterium]
MTISSSLNAGVAGLNANAARLAGISDNIANSATYGYKRVDTDFQSMVVASGSGGTFTAGGVNTSSLRLVDQRGPLVSTTNPTDLSISGRGLLPVTTSVAVGAGNGVLPLQLVTTGSFRPDAGGLLVSETGHVLMGWPAAADGSIPSFPRNTAQGLEPVRINTNQFAADPTTELTLGVNLPAIDSVAGASGLPHELSVEYFDNLGTSESLGITFTPTVPAAGASNEWTMTITDSASGDAVVGEYVLTFDASQASGGTLASVATVSGGAYDPATGAIDLVLAGGTVTANIGIPGAPGGMTQVSNSFAPTQIETNGSPVGNLTSVEVDENGMMRAIYDTGLTRTIYQIPVADVPNPNGLVAVEGQAYTISPESGAFFLWDAGDGPTGAVVGFSREESTTDVARELTDLIQTQRAYSSNAKVIQTVDEMLQETTNIKR